MATTTTKKAGVKGRGNLPFGTQVSISDKLFLESYQHGWIIHEGRSPGSPSKPSGDPRHPSYHGNLYMMATAAIERTVRHSQAANFDGLIQAVSDAADLITKVIEDNALHDTEGVLV